MILKSLPLFLSVGFLILFSLTGHAQQPNEKDTFFLAKQRGLLGRLGKSISTDPPIDVVVKLANPYLKFTGKTIRSIEFLSLGFERDIYDTSRLKRDLGVRLANTFHKNTSARVINHYLLFSVGDKLFPYLIADNERLLREQPYLKDARILVELAPDNPDAVEVTVITKDVFSIGGKLDVGNTTSGRAEVKEENLGGSGTRLLLGGFYDAERDPLYGYGASLLRRNIRGSFIDWDLGFRTYNNSQTSGRREETFLYSHFEKPLVSPYMSWTGALDATYNHTKDDYKRPPDIYYDEDLKYSYYSLDAWYGYNFGSKRYLYKNISTRLRKFVALRGFNLHYDRVPDSIKFRYQFANISGALVAFTMFKQNFYKANFIYGFGRTEDVPEGFTASLIGGWTNKKGRERPYYGAEAEASHFSKKGFYSTYTLRFGGFTYQNNFEDVEYLFNVEHFTRLRRMNPMWFSRIFINAGFAKQVNSVLNEPLNINSYFGLPYFSNGNIFADFRGAFKLESVFYNMKKFIGFRMAPFAFTGMTLVTPVNEQFKKSDYYSAIGAGVRTRNENLVFGTLELRGYYFPRHLPGMNEWKVELNTNIRFKYNSDFIHRPDFVNAN